MLSGREKVHNCWNSIVNLHLLLLRKNYMAVFLKISLVSVPQNANELTLSPPSLQYTTTRSTVKWNIEQNFHEKKSRASRYSCLWQLENTLKVLKNFTIINTIKTTSAKKRYSFLVVLLVAEIRNKLSDKVFFKFRSNTFFNAKTF